MSRGGGRGGGRGRGGYSSSSAMPPMGLTFADIQSMSREATAMYPPLHIPVLTDFTTDEKRIAEYQLGFAARMRKSAYYVVEKTKSTELPRYSDKYRVSGSTQPTLRRKDLNEAFFPPNIFDSYFNPKRKRKVGAGFTTNKSRMNLDELGDEDEEEKSGEGSDIGSQGAQSDYDVDEEYDNDYADNYFDNGEGDNMDDLGGGSGGVDDMGGGGDYE